MTTDAAEGPGGRDRMLFRAAALGICLLHTVLCLYTVWDCPLIEPDEPRYAEAGRTMCETGKYLIPEFNGRSRCNKPPLFYYLVAASNRVFGPTEIAARVPSILMGALAIFLTAWAGYRLHGAAAGMLAALVLFTSPLLAVVSRTIVTDMTLSCLFAASLFVFLAGYMGWMDKRRSVWLAGLLMGLAFFTKGPVSLIPVAVIMVFLSWERNWSYLRGARVWLAAVTFALVAFPWYVALWVHLGTPGFVRLCRFEIMGRLEGEVHAAPFYYFLVIIAATFLPWSLDLPGAAWLAVRRATRCGTDARSHGGRPDAERSALRFLLCWLVVATAILSMFRAKLATYILPVFPALSLLVAAHWLGLLDDGATAEDAAPAGRRSIPWDRTLAPALLLAVVGTSLVVPLPDAVKEALASDGIGDVRSLTLAFGALFAGPFLLARWGRTKAAAAIIATMLVLFYLDAAAHMGSFADDRSSREMCRQLREIAGERELPRCVRYKADAEGVSYYLRTRLEKLSTDGSEGAEWARDDALHALLAPDAPPAFCIVGRRAARRLMADGRNPGAWEAAQGLKTVVLTNLPLRKGGR